MDDLTRKVLAGEVEPAVSHAIVALQNIKLRAVEIERRLEEADVRGEFEELKRGRNARKLSHATPKN